MVLIFYSDGGIRTAALRSVPAALCYRRGSPQADNL